MAQTNSMPPSSAARARCRQTASGAPPPPTSVPSPASALARSPASLSTRPGTPSSATSRLEPRPTTATGTPSPAAQASRSTSSSTLAGSENQRAGPPVPSVVYRLSGTFSFTRPALPGGAGSRGRRLPRPPSGQPHPAARARRPADRHPRAGLEGAVDDDLPADARDRLLARGVDLHDHRGVRGRERRSEISSDVNRARVEVRLEEDDETAVGERAGGGDRGRELGRVMGVVVDEEHAPGAPVRLQPPTGASEAGERRCR